MGKKINMGLGFLLRLVMSDHDVAPLKKLFPTRNSGLAYLIKFRKIQPQEVILKLRQQPYTSAIDLHLVLKKLREREREIAPVG